MEVFGNFNQTIGYKLFQIGVGNVSSSLTVFKLTLIDEI